jgi:hypothetical protein
MKLAQFTMPSRVSASIVKLQDNDAIGAPWSVALAALLI